MKKSKTKFIAVLKDWSSTLITYIDKKQNVGHVLEYILAPTQKVYRRAMTWENPTLVIDSPILPAEHHIRLIRVKDPKIIKQVRRALRRNRSR